jgi:hypothetical protein
MWENSSAYSRVRFEDIAPITPNNHKGAQQHINFNKHLNFSVKLTPTLTKTPTKSSQQKPTTITSKS